MGCRCYHQWRRNPFSVRDCAVGKASAGICFDRNRKIGSTSGSFSDNRLELHYEFLDTTVYGTFDGGEFQGNYAEPGAPPIVLRAVRFVPRSAYDTNAPQVAGICTSQAQRFRALFCEWMATVEPLLAGGPTASLR